MSRRLRPRTARARSAATLVAAVLPALLVLPVAASRAWALCPNCLAQQSTLTPTLKLVGVFLVVPFVVAAAVYLAVRRTVYGRSVLAGPPSPPSLPASAPPSSDGGVHGS